VTPIPVAKKPVKKASPGAGDPVKKPKKRPSHADVESEEDFDMEEEIDEGAAHEGSKASTLPDKSAPVKFRVMGSDFSYFKDVMHFGGWYQAREFCREHGMELATFRNREQLMKVVTRLVGDPVWTGYYTNGQGKMLSSDPENAPWKIAFAMTGIPSNQPSMCGLLSVLLGKNVGIWPHACASPRTTLCGIHNGPEPVSKNMLRPASTSAVSALNSTSATVL
jgi:hypothetical protein